MRTLARRVRFGGLHERMQAYPFLSGDISHQKELAEIADEIRHDLRTRWRSQVRALPSARDLDVPTLNDHIPGLLEELAEALEAGSDETIA